MHHYRREDGSQPIALAVIGGVIGAAVALVFSEPRNRQKLQRVFQVLTEKGAQLGDQLQQQAAMVKDQLSTKAEELLPSEESSPPAANGGRVGTKPGRGRRAETSLETPLTP